MNDLQVKTKLDYYMKVGAIPSVILYGDTLWKKGWFGFYLIELPGGRQYEVIPPPPKIKARRGQMVTQDATGQSFVGIGSVAANITNMDGMDRYDSLQLILRADPQVAGIAISTRDGYIMDWIDRHDVPSSE